MRPEQKHEFQELAILSARRGSEYAVDHQSDIIVDDKGDGTSVTNVDKEVESIVKEVLEDETDFPVWGEESNNEPDSDSYWVVDPIDGTRNYADGLPIYTTSVALVDSEKLVTSCVICPATDTVWYATRGEGVYKDGEEISPTSYDLPAEGVRSSATGYRADISYEVCEASYGLWIRRFTAAVYSILTVAQGSTDVCVVSGAYPWDIGGPALIAKEAGAKIRSLPQHKNSWKNIMYGGFVCWNGNEKLWDDFIQNSTQSQRRVLAQRP